MRKQPYASGKFLVGIHRHKSNKRIRITLLAFAGAVMLFSCQKNDISLVNNLTRTDSLPTQVINDLTTIYTDSSVVQLIVYAPLVKHYSENEEPIIEFPDGIRVKFFNRTGGIASTLRSKYAIYYQSKDLWEARDSVIAINQQNERLDAALLYWDINTKRIYSDRSVKITSDDEIIYGEGFESDQSFRDWQIDHVKGTVYVNRKTKKNGQKQ
jgi:LPS export ABC transporter protein LptC